MIRTYTPADRATLTLPALPGLLDGWCGPVEEFIGPTMDQWALGVLFKGASMIPRPGTRKYRLPLSRPEARYRVACWLAEHNAPLWWALTPGPSALPVWQSAAILHASVLRVAAGVKVASGILGPWSPQDQEPGACVRPVLYSPADVAPIHLLFPNNRGWRANCPTMRGPETGEAGKLAADAAALTAGYVLLDGDTLRIEVPNE